MAPNRIIAVGASAGGVESLSALVALLPKDIDAAVFIVQHLPPDYSSKLPDVLSRKTPLKAAHARDGEEINRGNIYVAPPDHHLLVQEDRIVVARGPKENRFRPSIDALFRSIAYEFGPRAIGIVLSGALDDGTSGLWSIKRLRGVTVVQDPSEAAFDSMPMSAMQQVEIDHCLSVAAIGSLLQGLATIRPKEPCESPSDKERMRKEVSIAAEGNAFEKGVTEFGDYTPFTCPECDGVLIRIREGANSRYRCHTGHAYSGISLLSGTAERIEAGHWSVMRSLEETAMLLDDMSGVLVADEENEIASALRKEASLAKRRSKRILAMALEQAQAATYVAAGANKPKG